MKPTRSDRKRNMAVVLAKILGANFDPGQENVELVRILRMPFRKVTT